MKNTLNFDEKSQFDWCEWSSSSEIVPKGTLWRRFNHAGQRFYFAENKSKEVLVASGITTAIDLAFGEPKPLREWKDARPNWKADLKVMADYGTLCHIGLGELVKDGKISEETLKLADELFDKKQQFKKDMLCLKKFLIDYKVKVYFLEGILGREYASPSGLKSHICSAIDIFCQMTVNEKVKSLVQDGLYKIGQNKGLPKMVEVTEEKEVEVYAIIDLKSNFDEKEKKDYYNSHKAQLIFGRGLICENFDVTKEQIRMFNLSPLGWRTQPNYALKEHKIEVNAYGYDDEQLLSNRLNTALIEGIVQPKGLIFDIPDDIKMENSWDFRTLSYEEKAREILNEL